MADDDDITTHDFPELISTGELLFRELHRMYPLQSHKLVVADYVGVARYKRQYVHQVMRHVPLGSCTVSVFGALQRDITQVHGSESHFIAESRHGLPRPWHAVPIRLHKGNAFALPSNVVHAGGCVPFVQPKDSRRTIFFFDISTGDVTYRFTCGFAVPFWATQSTGPKEPWGCSEMGVEPRLSRGSVFVVARVPFVPSMSETSALGEHPHPPGIPP